MKLDSISVITWTDGRGKELSKERADLAPTLPQADRPCPSGQATIMALASAAAAAHFAPRAITARLLAALKLLVNMFSGSGDGGGAARRRRCSHSFRLDGLPSSDGADRLAFLYCPLMRCIRLADRKLHCQGQRERVRSFLPPFLRHYRLSSTVSPVSPPPPPPPPRAAENLIFLPVSHMAVQSADMSATMMSARYGTLLGPHEDVKRKPARGGTPALPRPQPRKKSGLRRPVTSIFLATHE